MNKEEAVGKLSAENYRVEPDQDFEVRLMEPEDARGIARCFFAVYGGRYPFDVYYVPERLIEANRSGDVYSVVARTAKGDVIGHAALYRSSAYSPNVYEYGQTIVLPEYRSSFAAICLQGYIFDNLVPQREEIVEMFAEAVCNHLVTQKMSSLAEFRETAIEVGLMPPKVYEYPEFPEVRVSTVMYFRSARDRRQDVYIPASYAQALEYILSGLDISRNNLPSVAFAPRRSLTELHAQFFDQAGVARFNVFRIGVDFPERIEEAEKQVVARGMHLAEVFVNLGEPWCGRAVDVLRERGFFLGGFLPRWFDTDGLLLQKLVELPPFESIKLNSERARKIVDFIRGDISGNPACGVVTNPPSRTP